MINILKKNKKEIIFGLIFMILAPIFNWLGDVLINFLVSINNNFSDLFYKSIAEQDPYKIESYTLLIIIYSIGIFLFFMNYSVSFFLDNLVVKKNESLKNFQNLKENEEETQKETNESISTSKERKAIKQAQIVVSIISIILFLMLFFTHLFYSLVNEKNNEFNRNLKILKPIISNQNVLYELEADWVQMKSKKDYEKIINIINKNLEDKEK